MLSAPFSAAYQPYPFLPGNAGNGFMPPKPYSSYAPPGYLSQNQRYSMPHYAASSYSSGYSAGYARTPSAPTVNLFLLKQQMGDRIIKTSREPVTLAQLAGKQDGDPVTASPFASTYSTGVASVDEAVQRMGDTMGSVKQGVGGFASTTAKSALWGGLGAMTISGGGMLLAKLAGKLDGFSPVAMGGVTLGAGLLGSLLGGIFGLIKGSYQGIRNIKESLVG